MSETQRLDIYDCFYTEQDGEWLHEVHHYVAAYSPSTAEQYARSQFLKKHGDDVPSPEIEKRKIGEMSSLGKVELFADELLKHAEGTFKPLTIQDNNERKMVTVHRLKILPK